MSNDSGHFWTRIVDSFGRRLKLLRRDLETGFKKMRFRSADSLVSCGWKAESCNKNIRSCGGLNHRVYEDAGITLHIFRKVACVFVMTDFLTKIIAKAVEVCSVTYTHLIAAGTRLKEISVLFPDLPKICVKQRPQSQSSGITVDISAEDVSYLFGRPSLRSNASLVECSPDDFVCAFCTWPKLKSSSGVGGGTKQGNDTGIIRKPSSICSRVCAGWSLDDNSSSSRCGYCAVNLQIKL